MGGSTSLASWTLLEVKGIGLFATHSGLLGPVTVLHRRNLTLPLPDPRKGSMVHIGCASAALAFAIFLGPRVDLNSANNDHVPHNLTYVQIGTGILWFGW